MNQTENPAEPQTEQADENKLIAQRRDKLDQLRDPGQRLPQRLPPRRPGRRPAPPLRRDAGGGTRRPGRAGQPGRAPHEPAHHGQGELLPHPGHVRAHPDLRPARHRGGGDLRRLQEGPGPGRHRRCPGAALQDQDRGAVPALRHASPADQGPAPIAGEVARPDRPGDPLPPALPGPHHQRGRPAHLPDPGAYDPVPARLPERPRLPGGGNAHDARHPGRGGGAALRHPPPRPGHAALPAHRPRAVPQAPGGRGLRAGLRDQSQFPQRGALHPPQPRVHHGGVLPGLRRLPRPDGPDRGPVPRHGPDGAGHHHPDPPGQQLRLRPALPSPVRARCRDPLQRGRHAGAGGRPGQRPRPGRAAATSRPTTPGVWAGCRSPSSRRPASTG